MSMSCAVWPVGIARLLAACWLLRSAHSPVHTREQASRGACRAGTAQLGLYVDWRLPDTGHCRAAPGAPTALQLMCALVSPRGPGAGVSDRGAIR